MNLIGLLKSPAFQLFSKPILGKQNQLPHLAYLYVSARIRGIQLPTQLCSDDVAVVASRPDFI